MEYQWYPGHMTKAMRMMQEEIRLVDLVIELVDARVPLSGRNPDIDRLGAQKGRLVLFTKADLADPEVTDWWVKDLREKGMTVSLVDARSRNVVRGVEEAIRSACSGKIERDRRRGIRNRPVRAMVTGIPNVGKSTLINTLAGRSAAKTGNKPGVTRGKQWIRLNSSVELLDTPGVLWPKFEDPRTGLHLAMIGSIRDEIMDSGELAISVIDFLKRYYPGRLKERYGVDESASGEELLPAIALRRGCLKKGQVPDLDRVCALLMDDFRSGRLGMVTLDRPAEVNGNEEKGSGAP